MDIARPHRAFFLVAAASALAYVSVPHDTAYYDRWYQLFPIAAVLATLVGVAVNRPRARTPWYLVALSGMCAVAADAVYATQLQLSETVPFPSSADFLALASYAVLAAALLLMIRSQAPGRDWPSLIDAGIVTAGVAIVGWTFLVQPRLLGESSALETAVALAFPVMDVLLVSLAARMVLGPGMRTAAFGMVTVALLFQLVGDALYGFGSLHGWYRVGDPVDLLFVLAAVLWGTAALHPSMVDLTEPNPDPEQRLGGKRLAALSLATLMAPAMLAVAALRAGSSELLVIVGAAATLSALVIVRLAGLVARHERAERRERLLGTTAAALVSAWTRDDVYRVAVDAALEMAGSEDATVGLALGGVTDFRIVAARGRDPERIHDLDALSLSDDARAALSGSRASGDPGTVALSGESGEWTVVCLAGADGVRGAFVFLTPERLPRHVREGAETLAAQVALALESASLAEDLHERQSAARFRSLVQNSSDVILLLEPDLSIRYHTPSLERMLGYRDDELAGASLGSFLDDDASDLREFLAVVCADSGATVPRDLPLRGSDGTVIRLESVFNNLLDDPNVEGVVVTARDVTERRALEDQLAYQAYHDSLTGLANRALFGDRVMHALERSLRHPSLLGVLLIDLDDFKTVNDSLGHAAGDELLVEVAQRIRSCVRPEDTCARLGGDEFAVMIEQIESPEAATRVADRILRTLAQPLTVLGSEVVVQGSVGIALSAGERQTADEIMRSADLAMYRAKNEGKGKSAVFEPAMHSHVLERLALKADLQRADLGRDFVLHYQPIVTVQTGAIVGVEALLRWNHPVRGLVLPGAFIDVAEEMGIALPLGRQVLLEACRQASAWRSAGHSLGVYVNLSAKQLASSRLRADVVDALREAGLAASVLTLEITESTLLDTDVVGRRLEELESLGVRIAIDDFGTGYSSLNHLRRFPVDTLKVAKAFVEELGSRAEQERLVAAILRLGSTLGLESIAEGVESEKQRARLRALGCRLAQGSLFAPPLPAVELEALLRRAQVA